MDIKVEKYKSSDYLQPKTKKAAEHMFAFVCICVRLCLFLPNYLDKINFVKRICWINICNSLTFGVNPVQDGYQLNLHKNGCKSVDFTGFVSKCNVVVAESHS